VKIMSGQPEIMSWGRGGREPHGRFTLSGRGLAALAVVLACLAGAVVYTGLLASRRASTIDQLRAMLQAARQREPSATTGADLPVAGGSAALTFPDGTRGEFSMVVAQIRPRPGAGALTWLFVYGRHATPGQRYGLLGGTCGGQYVTPADWADGIADARGDLAIVAPNLLISPRDRSVWALVYQARNGESLGGIKGPLTGGGARTFRSTPPC
jgi:hypothetical protein